MIDFNNVKKSYPNGTLALDGVDLHIEDGEFVFIVGHSGAGKTTMMKLLLCEERPTSGKITVGDYELSTLSRFKVPYYRRELGVVFQDFRLFPKMTVFENVAFAMHVVGTPSRVIKRRVPAILNTVNLTDKFSCFPNELSGGEQQRVALARALANNPKIIIADEPTGNIDPRMRKGACRLLQAARRQAQRRKDHGRPRRRYVQVRRFSLKYALSQAFQGLWRNGVMSFASIAVLMSCLVVIGGFALIVLNINLNLNSLGNLNQIVVFVNEDMTEEDIVAVGEKIASLDNVDTVERITKDEALRQLKAQAGDKQDAYDYITDENNPLVDEFVISYSDPAKVVDLDYALKHMDGIAKVNNRLDLASQLESFRSGVLMIFVWFLAVLIIVTVFIIVNTIKLSVYSRRHEITVMRYVGATGMFIAAPFILEGIIIGIFSAILSYFLEWYAYYYVEQKISSDLQMISFVGFSEVSGYVLGGFIALGILTGIVGSLLSLRKYLKA